jgi:tetratricopeptide (TPR) repeat protein
MRAHFRSFSFALFCAGLVFTIGRAQQPAPTNAASSAMTSPSDAAKKMIDDAIQKRTANDMDGALSSLSQALKLNPNSTGAYVLRASIYYQKKQWDLAANDFRAALVIAPKNAVLKFNLAEVEFQQKQYDKARADLIPLQTDPDMGDFASYKIFLCDLFGGHVDTAKKELDALNDAMNGPSCEFGNAAWQLLHKKLDGDDGARYWLLRASRVYPPAKNNFYAQSLRDLGYLPIPGPDDNVTPPGAGNPAHP